MLKRGVVVVSVVLAAASCRPEPEADPCGGIDCGQGRCAVVGTTAACLCNAGFQAVGMRCEPVPPADLCASNPCAALSNSLCLVTNGTVRCACPDSRVEVNGACVLRTPCTPNPCTNLRRTTCEVVGGAASCRCDEGYAPEGDLCSAAPLWTCSAQHVDGDNAEPDECPPLARVLNFDTPEPRSIMPAGDHDWFSLAVTPGRLMEFSASSSTGGLLIEVYEPTGIKLLASDNRGTLNAAVVFVAPASEKVLVRVRAVRGTDTGTYEARYRELGADDYANQPADAVTIVPATGGFAGEVQYAGDIDVVWLELPTGVAVNLARPDAGEPNIVVQVARPDGGARVLELGEATTITLPSLEPLVLTARGRNPRDLGAFSVALTEFGLDDHSDEPLFGTPLPTTDTLEPGTLQRLGDIDSFNIEQVSGRLYRARWSSLNSSVRVTVLDGNGVVLANSYASASTGAVWKATSGRPAAVRVERTFSSTSPVTYSVAAEDLGLDDHSDVLTNATPIPANTPASGRLELSADVDTFSFNAVAGRIMQVTATIAPGSPAQALRLRLYGPTGGVLSQGDGTVGTVAASAGTYRVQVERAYASSPDLVRYSLAVTDLGADDHGDTAGSASTLTPGTPVTGSTQYASDLDVFQFTPTLGHVYDVSCTRPMSSCAFRVINSGGQTVLNNSYSSGQQSFLADLAGTWLVEVSSGSPYTPLLGSFTVTVTDRGAEDHGETNTTATAVTLGTPVAGRIGFSQDIDVFSVPVVSGRIYRATATGSASSLRFEVRNSANTVLTSATYVDQVSFIAPSTGTLYVHVSAGFSTVAYTYSLSVAELGVDDHPNTASSGTALAVGTPARGEVQYRGDLDYFNLAVTARRHYRVSCVASAGTCGLSVENGATVLASAYASTTATANFTAPSGLTSVAIRVSANDTGTFELTVTDLGLDDHGDTLADATALTIDAAATAGVLAVTTDVDVFTVSAPVGQVMNITCTTTSGSACALTVYSSNGATLSNQSGGAQVVTGVLSAGGATRIEVRGQSYTQLTGSYTLQVTRGQDDVTTPTPITTGTHTGSIDYVGDTDVFQLSLTAGTPVRLTISYYARAQLNTPTGGYATMVYGGTTGTTYTPTVSGTFTLTVSGDYSVPTGPYTLTVQ